MDAERLTSCSTCYEGQHSNLKHPCFTKVYYFYNEYQEIFTDVQRQLPNIEFIKFHGFEITKNLLKYLLIYGDLCGEIFNDNDVVKFATSGRHRKLHIIYVKHDLFHQSKGSRTIDLNTTHINLFRSLRDIQQIEYLGKQLNCLQLLTDAYKLATTESYGHLFCDLDPKTTQDLRFSSNLIGPEPSVFHITLKEGVITPIANKKKSLHMLKLSCVSNNSKSKTRYSILKSNLDFIWFHSDCVMNVLSGVVPINKTKIQNF